MSKKTVLVLATGLLFSGCGTTSRLGPVALDGLRPLLLEGHELHDSLVTPRIDSVQRLHVPRALLKGNPQLSTDAEFVEAITRGGSQGRLSSEGVRAALYALYLGETQLGFYGLEAESLEDADRLENLIRGTWVHNESLQRARVHRKGKVLLVIWHDGVSASCWESVNAVVMERMAIS